MFRKWIESHFRKLGPLVLSRTQGATSNFDCQILRLALFVHETGYKDHSFEIYSAPGKECFESEWRNAPE